MPERRRSWRLQLEPSHVSEAPVLFVLADPNGAGKSLIGREARCTHATCVSRSSVVATDCNSGGAIQLHRYPAEMPSGLFAG